jgi:hypothetical protein
MPDLTALLQVRWRARDGRMASFYRDAYDPAGAGTHPWRESKRKPAGAAFCPLVPIATATICPP